MIDYGGLAISLMVAAAMLATMIFTGVTLLREQNSILISLCKQDDREAVRQREARLANALQQISEHNSDDCRHQTNLDCLLAVQKIAADALEEP